MPFVTDDTWSPARYRIALAAWQRNAPKNESKIMPRKAEPTSSPRHGELSKQLRGLLAWRAAASPKDWTTIAANDNKPSNEPELLDSDYTIRPRTAELLRAVKDVGFIERKHAKLDGGGALNVVPIDGDIERGKVWRGAAGRGQRPDCITRLGRLEFSNGAAEESALIRDAAGKVVRGSVRIPLGGLTRIGRYKAYERFAAPKGSDNDNLPSPTVGMSATSNPGRFEFNDPVADAEHAIWIRQAVKPETADLLDFAMVAANFKQIGERLGYTDKAAERQGKAALIMACAELESALAA